MIRKITPCILLMLIILISNIVTSGNAYAWFDQSWGFRQVIIIDNAQVPGDLTNFPVLVSVTDPNLRVISSGNVGKANGGDILFTSSDAMTQLDHEIEKYSPSTGELVAWVKVPNVSATSDTVIFMYYGNPGASDQWDVDGTWDSNFLAVWHLAEDPSTSTDGDCGGGTKEICDSTSNNVDGDSGGGMTSGDQVAGQIDGSLDFDGSNDYIDLGNAIQLTDNITVEAWINTRSIPPAWQPGDPDVHWRTFIGEQWEWHFEITDDEYFGSGPRVIFRRWQPPRYMAIRSETAILTDQWYYVAFTLATNELPPGGWPDFDWNNYNGKLYLNGILDIERAMVTPLKTNITTPLRMARRVNTDIDWFDGFIDEVRMSDTVRSPDWIEASYNNQNNPSSTNPNDPPPFLSFGAPVEFTPVPTMTQWGMIIFMFLAGSGAVYNLWRKKKQQ